MLLAVFCVDLVVCIGTHSRGVRGVVCVIGVCSGTLIAGVYDTGTCNIGVVAGRGM